MTQICREQLHKAWVEDTILQAMGESSQQSLKFGFLASRTQAVAAA